MKAVLVGKKLEARDTYSFFLQLEKPSTFIPGQFIYVTIPHLKYPDFRGNMRQFSISSAPHEKLWRITARMRSESGYKKTLDEISVGSELDLEGPTGVYYWGKETQGDHIFIAGGVGIAPFMSRILFSANIHQKVTIRLLYTNRTRHDGSFIEDLEEIKRTYSPFLPIYFFTREGRRDRIDRKVIQIVSKKLIHPTYWITGTPEMVDSIEEILVREEIPNESIVTEKFTGY